MSLWNPFAFDIHGEPAQLGMAPPALRVVGGQASAVQLAAAQFAFAQFCAAARTARVANPRRVGRLPDGSRYEIVVAGPATTMTLWPESGGSGFIAWTAFVDREYLPMWERPIVDFPSISEVLGPEPQEPPPPQPPQTAGVGGSIYEEYVSQVSEPHGTFEVYRRRRKRVTVRATHAGGTLYTGETSGEIVKTANPIGCASESPGGGTVHYPSIPYWAYSTWPSGGGPPVPDTYQETWTPTTFTWQGEFFLNVDVSEIMEVSTSFHGYETSSGFRAYAGPCVDEDDWSIPEFPWASTGLLEAAFSAAEQFNTAEAARYEAEFAAWEIAYGAWRAEHSAWLARKEALENGTGREPYEPVIAMRKQARDQQVAAVAAHLLTGIGDLHLTARLLSFPYNVAYRSEPPAGSGGTATGQTQSIYAGGVVVEERRTTQLLGAQAHTALNGYRLRRDLMPPECLFGWRMDGTIVHAKQFVDNHLPDPLALKPPGLANLYVTFDPGYFAGTRLAPDEAAGLVVDSDAFVRPGARFIIVLFEYRVLDPFTGEHVWTPCPDMVLHDSIWLRSRGGHTDTPRFTGEGGASTTQVRVASIIEQTRTGWQAWSPARTWTAGSFPSDCVADYAALIEQIGEPPNTPTAVVIAEGLPREAQPARLQSGGFYRGATFLWSGDRDAITTAKAQSWQPSAAAAPHAQFIVRALVAARKVAP